MAILISLSDDRTYILVRVVGNLVVEETRQAMTEVVSLIASSHVTRMLVDARERQSRFTVSDEYDVGEMIALQPAYRNVAIAVVVPEALTDQRFIEMVAHNRGANFHSFNDYDQALAWLGVGTPKHQEIRIPS